ncbi:putative ribonuclease H-like domain-containing protein, partial [Tanacetum coccineum]
GSFGISILSYYTYIIETDQEESNKSEVESWGKDEDDSNNDHDSRSEGSDQEREEDEFVKTPSNDTDDEDETKIKDKVEGEEDEGIDYTTNQFDDDVDLRMNEPVTTDEGFIQKEGTDAEMINVQQGNENLEISINIPHTDAEYFSLMDVLDHHEVPSNQTPTPLTVPVYVIFDSSYVYSIVIPQSLQSLTPQAPQSTPTPPPITKATIPPSELPNFASIFQFNNRVTALEKEKGEYDIWAMKMEHYLAHTDYPIWEVIQRGNGPFEDFSVSNSEGLHKGYDRFQSLLSQLEIHGAGVSTEDANQKFLSTNEVSTTYSASSSSGHNPQREGSSLYTDELILKKFYKKTGRKLQFDAKEPVGFDKAKVECYNYHKIRHFARECRSKGNQDCRRRDARYTGHSEDEQENYALMAYSNSGSDIERKQLGDASIEIQAYTQALKKVEAQLVAHQQNQLWYKENISQMSARDNAGLGYGIQMNKGVLSYENEVFESVFYSRSSDIEDSPVNDRYAEGMHAVPPLMTGIYISSGPDVEINESQFTYGPKQSKLSEFDARSSDFNSCESNSSEETLKSMPEPVVNKTKVVSQPKVWSDAPIIEEYESDSDDEHVSLPTKEQETPSFAFVKITVSNVKNSRQNVIEPIHIYTPTTKTNIANQKVNTAGDKAVSVVGGIGKTAVKPSTDYVWRPKRTYLNKFSKYNGGLNSRKFDVPHKALENKGIVDSGCSSHMTGNKAYLVNIKDYNGGPIVGFWRFSWVFFLRTKDETSGILKDFIRQIENQLNKKVKTIRCNNGTKFKNRDMIEFCGSKGIKREYSNARTLQQNGVAERKNKTLIEAARTMLADSFLPNTFWAEAVSTACYVLNRVLVTKPQNKTPYELITGKIPIISYIRPFGCHVTILNTIDHLGKFDGKSDKGFLVGYSLNSKAFRVYNLETKRVEENLHITFLENKPNVVGKGPNWLFDLDYLTDLMNYQPVRLENQANKTAGPKEANHSAEVKNEGEKPNKSNEKLVDQEDQAFLEELERHKSQEKEANDATKALRKEFAQDTEDLLLQAGAARVSSTNTVNTASTPVSTASPSGGLSYTDLTNSDQDDTQIAALDDSYNNPNDGIFTNASYDDEGAVADFTNLETIVNVSPIPTSRIHSVHPSTQILGDPKSAVQTRSKVNKSSGAHAFKISEELEDESWIDAILEELLQFKIQKVWILVDLPHGKKEIRTKWVYRNKKDERGVMVRNKARLVAHGHRQEEGIDYDEVFAPMARIEAIRIFLAFASYMGFIVYQMDVKSDFLYGTIDEETASTPIETQKPLVKDKEATDVDVYLYRSMIGSLMYLTASRPKYYVLQFMLVLGNPQQASRRCCVPMLWASFVDFRNSICSDYGFNLMNTKIYIDIESTICIVKNPVFHSKTKHIEIRHHFIRDAYEKKLIQAALVKGRQDDLLYSLYGMFCEQKNLDYGDVFHRVIWVLESNWRELSMLKNVPVPLDHFLINALTSIELKPDLSLRPSHSDPIPDSNPEGSGGNHGGQSSSDRSLSGNEDGPTL